MPKRMTDLEIAITLQVTDEVKDKKGKKQSCSGFCLQSLDSTGNVRDEIYTRMFDGHPMTPEEATETVQRRADVYASGHEDRVQFELGFFFGDDRLQRPYRFFVDSPIAAGAIGGGEATAKGLVKDMSRALNQTLAQTFAQQQAMMDASNRTIERLSNSLEKMAEQKEEKAEMLDAAIGHLFQLRFAAEDKSHEHKMKELEKEKSALFWKKIIEMAPAAINALAGKTVLPGGDTSILKMVGAALQNQPELAMKVLGSLPAEGQGILADRMMTLKAEEEEEAARKKEAMDLANGVRTPAEIGSGNATH